MSKATRSDIGQTLGLTQAEYSALVQQRRSADVSACDHRWQRLPVVDLSVIYRCQQCERAVLFNWLAAAGGTLDDLDRAFEAKYGGKVEGPP